MNRIRKLFPRNEGNCTDHSYGKLKYDVSQELTRRKCQEVATFFNLRPAEMDCVAESITPGITLLQILEEKALIAERNCDALQNALEQMNMNRAASIIKSYIKHLKNSDCILKGPKVNCTELEENTELFIECLHIRYETMYDSKRTMPYMYSHKWPSHSLYMEVNMDILNPRKGRRQDDQKVTISSYHEIFTHRCLKNENRIVIEGEPGFGKTTLALQLAHSWCNASGNSPLRNIKIFILIQLNKVKEIGSLVDAIRLQLLPVDITLTVDNIKAILDYNKACVFVFDGLDEYIGGRTGSGQASSDIFKILKNMMLIQHKVIITSRPSSMWFFHDCWGRRLRLKELTAKQRSWYITSTFSGDEGTRTLSAMIEGNPFMLNLCSIPLLFTLVVHTMHEDITNDREPSLNRATVLFKHVATCFIKHHCTKQRLPSEPMTPSSSSKFAQLAKLCELACKGLCSDVQQTKWNKKYMSDSSYLDFWIENGILLEEEIEADTTFLTLCESESLNDDSGDNVQVKFFHIMFQEWFAAQHLSHLMKRDINMFKQLLEKCNPKYVDHLFRFVCGLEGSATCYVIDYLLTLKDEWPYHIRNCIIHCFAEHDGDKEHLLRVVKRVCEKPISIYHRDNRMLQNAKVSLLQLASSYKIPVEKVNLCGVIESIGHDGIRLESGIVLPPLMSVESFVIIGYEHNKNPGCHKLLQYVAKSPVLKRAWFHGEMGKPVMKNDANSIPFQHNAKVFWFFKKWYQLDLSEWKWKANIPGEDKRNKQGEMFLLDICLLD